MDIDTYCHGSNGMRKILSDTPGLGPLKSDDRQGKFCPRACMPHGARPSRHPSLTPGASTSLMCIATNP